MAADLELLTIDPHEFFGVILNMPRELIANALASEIAQTGYLELWKFQAALHHDHPFAGLEDEALAGEMEAAEIWADILRSRFPSSKFVIEVRPFDQMTWYQAKNDAPIGDEDFRIYSVQPKVAKGHNPTGTRSQRQGHQGDCERCGAPDNFGPPQQSENHRGIRLIDCLTCGENLVHSIRTIRILVG